MCKFWCTKFCQCPCWEVQAEGRGSMRSEQPAELCGKGVDRRRCAVNARVVCECEIQGEFRFIVNPRDWVACHAFSEQKVLSKGIHSVTQCNAVFTIDISREKRSWHQILKHSTAATWENSWECHGNVIFEFRTCMHTLNDHGWTISYQRRKKTSSVLWSQQITRPQRRQYCFRNDVSNLTPRPYKKDKKRRCWWRYIFSRSPFCAWLQPFLVSGEFSFISCRCAFYPAGRQRGRAAQPGWRGPVWRDGANKGNPL